MSPPLKLSDMWPGTLEGSGCYAVHVARNELHVSKNESEKQSRTSNLIIDVHYWVPIRPVSNVLLLPCRNQLTTPENTITYHNALCLLSPKFCIIIVFSFSWELKWPQEKLKTMLMQNFGMTNKEHYGMLWYILEWSIDRIKFDLSTAVARRATRQ